MKDTGDVICILLGYEVPILLRPSPQDDTFIVVGFCYIHGIMDGEVYLGSLPSFCQAKVERTGRGGKRFFNSDTKTLSKHDPRLGTLTEDWESLAIEPTPDDPYLYAPHRNKVTCEFINSDPRLSPDALVARGIKLQKFRLL